MTVAARARLLPTRADLIDAGLLAVLAVLGLVGLGTTYAGVTYLWVGLTGLVLGVFVAHLANVLRQPVITTAAMTVAVFFLAGGAVALRERAIGGVLPSGGTVRGLADGSVNGWKQLLTTLPPVNGSGPLLVLPYLLGLLCGAGGFALATRMKLSAAPVAAPGLLLVAGILLGTGQPPARLAQGVGFGIAALCWMAVRARRLRPPLRDGSRTAARTATAVTLLGASALGAAILGPLLPGAGNAHRTVLRDFVTPPFEFGAYPSPLVGFRKYTKDANQLWDQTLFTVSGLPEGATVRIATLDAYDGSVWGATSGRSELATSLAHNAFQRVGARIPQTVTGNPATVRITIGAAYASADDVNAWLPTTGFATAIAFSGVNATAHTDSLRYNLTTSSGIVGDRLRAGDSYTVAAVLTSPAMPADPQPFGPPELDPMAGAVVNGRAAKWAGTATGVGAQLRAVAAYLRDHGAYSDGGPGETEYLPGHSVGRLTAFLNARQPVGDDEQYAAAFALIANSLGMPARAVVGAKPAADGVVRGGDVHAWVEIHLADGTWVAIPNSEFMPDPSKKPDHQPPQSVDNTDASIVPPPNTTHPPGSLDDTSQADTNANRRTPPPTDDAWHLPAWVAALLIWFGSPLLGIGMVGAAIIGGKAARRRRRRTSGRPDARFASGWREIVDHARDLGRTVPYRHTRREQAEHLADLPVVRGLAEQADWMIFGPVEPAEADAAEYWREVDLTRRRMSRAAGRLRRIRAAINLRTIRLGTT